MLLTALTLLVCAGSSAAQSGEALWAGVAGTLLSVDCLSLVARTSLFVCNSSSRSEGAELRGELAELCSSLVDDCGNREDESMLDPDREADMALDVSEPMLGM